MIRWLRDVFCGGTGRHAADAALDRAMAEVLAALDTVIDDDAALGRIYALGRSLPGVASGWRAGTAAGQACSLIGLPGSAARAAGAGGAAPSRRLAARSAAAVAAALAAAAVAVAAIAMPGARHNSADLTAYIVKRVDSALSQAGVGPIAQMTVTTRSAGGSTVAEEWSYGDRWRVVTYSTAGHLVHDEGFSTASVFTVVNYLTRTWARQHGLGRPATLAPGLGDCGPVIAALPLLFQPGGPGGPAGSLLPLTVATGLRAAVSCGTLAVSGRQHVDGVEAIELASSADSPISETIWVSPGTYLPVRVVIRPAPGAPGPSQTADITWLPSTVRNLARLGVPVPAGFRQIPFGRAVTPSMQHIRVSVRT
jgi:hypothetical protein